MSFFNRSNTDNAKSRLNEEMIYAQVAVEIQNGIRRDGLWAKAIALAELNEDKAKAIYIKLRAQSIIDEATLTKEITETHEKNKNFEKNKENNKNHTNGSIGSTEKILTCINCNRSGKMLIKKMPMHFSQKIIFVWLGGIPGYMIASTLFNGDSFYTSSFILISYLSIYFLFYNKKYIQCPSCGNIGEVNQ